MEKSIIESGFNLQIFKDVISVLISVGNMRSCFYVKYNSIQKTKGDTREHFIFRFDGNAVAGASFSDETIKFSNNDFFTNIWFEVIDKEKRDLIYKTIKEIMKEIKQKEQNEIQEELKK